MAAGNYKPFPLPPSSDATSPVPPPPPPPAPSPAPAPVPAPPPAATYTKQQGLTDLYAISSKMDQKTAAFQRLLALINTLS